MHSLPRGDELADLQLQGLRDSIARAHSAVPSYRKRCEAAGVHPADLESLADLARFPFTNKQDLRDQYPFGGLAIPREQVACVHTSSALAGRPTLMGFSHADLERWAALMARTLEAGGVRPGDLVHIAFPYGLHPGGMGAHLGAEALGCTVLPMSEGRIQLQAQLLAELRPRVVIATPSYLQAIFDAMRLQGRDPRHSGVALALLGGEPWSETQRERLESEGELRALDLYGVAELIGPGLAVEALGEREGCVIWEDQFYPEIIDPVSGAVLPYDPVEGTAVGELVLSSLHLQAQPLIRFRTHDLTRLLPPGPLGQRRMARIQGRSDDQVLLRGLKFSPADIESFLVEDPLLAPHYRLLLSRPQTLDELRLEVELRDAREVWNRDPIASRTAARLQSLLGLDCQVSVVHPGSLERGADGKVKRVVDRRP